MQKASERLDMAFALRKSRRFLPSSPDGGFESAFRGLDTTEANIQADFYMVAGDYNADGSYFDEESWTSWLKRAPKGSKRLEDVWEDTAWAPILAQIPNYTLFTGWRAKACYKSWCRNDLDTTLALSSNTYDRIIASSALEALLRYIKMIENA